MKILKRNQLIILIISLMLVTAGYLNFTSTNEKTTDVVASLGDATLVNSNATQETEEEIITHTELETDENNISTAEKTTKDTDKTETVETVQEDTYFTTSKLERENMYSQILETYQEIYNNTNSSVEQKQDAINQIAKINETRNSIMIAENLCLAKGFQDIVIFANANSISVIVKAEKLEPEQIAQLQNIISRELEVGAESINISTK